jgi:hypothetical protein
MGGTSSRCPVTPFGHGTPLTKKMLDDWPVARIVVKNDVRAPVPDQVNVELNADPAFDQLADSLSQLITVRWFSVAICERSGRDITLDDNGNVDLFMAGNAIGDLPWNIRLKCHRGFLDLVGRNAKRGDPATPVTLKMPLSVKQQQHPTPGCFEN